VSERNLCQIAASNRLSHYLRTDRRRELRHTITLPVTGSNPQHGRWSESGETLNVSSGGLALHLSKQVMIGDILYVDLPLPARFQKDIDPRADIEPPATYNTYARVRFVEVLESQQIVRLQFLRSPISTAHF
jgi:PilZ domain-containing protein